MGYCYPGEAVQVAAVLRGRGWAGPVRHTVYEMASMVLRVGFLRRRAPCHEGAHALPVQLSCETGCADPVSQRGADPSPSLRADAAPRSGAAAARRKPRSTPA